MESKSMNRAAIAASSFNLHVFCPGFRPERMSRWRWARVPEVQRETEKRTGGKISRACRARRLLRPEADRAVAGNAAMRVDGARAVHRAEVPVARRTLLDARFADTPRSAGHAAGCVGESAKRIVVMVTHDIDEALYLADRLILMTDGPEARVGEILHGSVRASAQPRRCSRSSGLLRLPQLAYRFSGEPRQAVFEYERLNAGSFVSRRRVDLVQFRNVLLLSAATPAAAGPSFRAFTLKVGDNGFDFERSGGVQSRAAVRIGNIHIDSEVDQHLHGFEN